MYKKAPTKVVRLQVLLGIKGMDDPELISRSARRDVVALLHVLSVEQPMGPLYRRINHREEHHIAFVALKMGGRSTDDPALLVCDRVQEPLQQRIDLSRLFFSIHMSLVWLFVGVIVLHMLAGLKHWLIDKDKVLQRMWF